MAIADTESIVADVLRHFTAYPLPLSGTKMEYVGDLSLKHSRRARNIPDRLAQQIESMRLDASNEDDLGVSHAAQVARGLLFLAIGGLDECHNLITPYSWEHPTGFAGPPVPDSPAEAEAIYAHALVHRWEGKHVSEMGIGWTNASFWFGQLTSSHSFFSAMKEKAAKLAMGKANLETHLRKLGLDRKWSPSRFLKLCREACKDKHDSKDLHMFCNTLCAFEWRLLLDYCLEVAGYPGMVAAAETRLKSRKRVAPEDGID